jgi:hypothetical protein
MKTLPKSALYWVALAILLLVAAYLLIDKPYSASTTGTELSCTNNIDDDSDSLVDCADVEDCANDPACRMQTCPNPQFIGGQWVCP